MRAAALELDPDVAPIAGDGTSSCSTGRPCREYAAAGAVCPVSPTAPGTSTTIIMTTANIGTQPPAARTEVITSAR